MKKIILYIVLFFVSINLLAQDDIYPAGPQKETIIIKNGTIHTATGAVIENGVLVLKNGKIFSVGKATSESGTIIDATGKHIYPGMILAGTDLGLKEIGSGVRGSNDYNELGDYNTSIRSLVAYNTDSRVINTLRSNGILLANVEPQGSLLTGSSSVVQLDAWNWEDAVYQADNGMHLNIPRMMQPFRRFFMMQQGTGGGNLVQEGISKIEEVERFLKDAKAYLNTARKTEINLKFEALRPLFEKKQKLFVHADISRQILMAIDFAKKFDIDVVVVGGSDSYLVADLLKQNNIPVILNAMHNLPVLDDDDIDQPFKTPAMLQKAGVLFAINDNHSNSRYRNLPFNAGTAVAYGLDKEQALQALTINAAKILGIDKKTGSIEVGKDANIIISQGDLFDMKSSVITDAFIQGRKIDLNNKQTQLYERYRHRYGIN